MKQVIDWLIQVEDLALRFYAAASELPGLGAEFSEFLVHLSEDEAWHGEVMERALSAWDRGEVAEAAVVLDQEVGAQVRGTFEENLGRLEAGRLAPADVLDCVLTTELSEWNQLFLYVVRSAGPAVLGGREVPAHLRRHLREVRRRLGSGGGDRP